MIYHQSQTSYPQHVNLDLRSPKVSILKLWFVFACMDLVFKYFFAVLGLKVGDTFMIA